MLEMFYHFHKIINLKHILTIIVAESSVVGTWQPYWLRNLPVEQTGELLVAGGLYFVADVPVLLIGFGRLKVHQLMMKLLH